MNDSRIYSEDTRDTVLADYHASGDSVQKVADRHGVSKSALQSWIKPPAPRKPKTWAEEEIAYAGEWINVRGVQYPTEREWA